MLLAIDCGNTRLKWGVHDGAGWLGQGAALNDRLAAELCAVLASFPAIDRVIACNVAGDAVGNAIESTARSAHLPLFRLCSSAACAGVHNRYEQPETLGADRWAALIGARALGLGACVVVAAGTATTVDALDAAGVFLGGLILPGYDLMRRSLAAGTANLPLADGECTDFPRTTNDAIVSGCLEAQVGAIERMLARLPDAMCILAGGAASLLATRLNIRHRLHDNLVLDGLVHVDRFCGK